MNIGDTVVLKSAGLVYTTYDTKFKELGFKDTVRNPSREIEISYKDILETEFTVFGLTTHEDDSSLVLIGIENKEGIQLLIAEQGLSLVHTEK